MNTRWTDPNNFTGCIITDCQDKHQVRLAMDDYKTATLCVLDGILKRYERNPDYHFIDTKLSLVSGKDFAADDPLRGRNTIFSWIQGRGLEALAGHDWWIQQQGDLDPTLKADFHRRITQAVGQVLEQMESLRKANADRLYFMMTPQGRILKVDGQGNVVPAALPPSRQGQSASTPPTSMNDMFYSKGMMAAGKHLGRQDIMDAAERLFLEVWRDVCDGRLYSDQQQLDPRNPVTPTPGKKGNGGRMIGIGAAALFLQCTGKAIYSDIGLECIDYILTNHVNAQPADRPAQPALQPYDMWEANDEKTGQPYARDGRVLSDSGHATEFVGLALKLIAAIESIGQAGPTQLQQIARCKAVLPKILRQNFNNGFSAKGYGICKSFDLISRRAINDQMPWWSLPETIRAATEAIGITDGADKAACIDIAVKSANAFSRHFVRRELGLMAYQTIDADGNVVDAIPATPDADPAYHTGLSIIDAIEVVQKSM